MGMIQFTPGAHFIKSNPLLLFKWFTVPAMCYGFSRKLIRRRVFMIYILNLALATATASNFLLFLTQSHSSPTHILKSLTHPDFQSLLSPIRLPVPPPSIPYTPSELSAAIISLRIPAWSRGHIPCSEPESEVTCSQIVRAWRLIKRWSDLITSTPLLDRRWIQARHYENGVGNRLSTDTIIFLLALMVVKGFHLKVGEESYRRGNAYKYDSAILD
jgi:hypothetical protein